MQVPDPVPDFQYYNGLQLVHGDRLAIYRQLLIRTRGNPNALADRVFAVKPDETDIEKLTDSWEAAEQLEALVRELFAMAPFDPGTGQGARSEHCWLVWDQFCASMSEAKKKPGTSPTSCTPTAVPGASPLPGSSGSACS